MALLIGGLKQKLATSWVLANDPGESTNWLATKGADSSEGLPQTPPPANTAGYLEVESIS